MVDISHESPDETDARLRLVIRAAKLTVFDTPYAFEEFPIDRFPAAVDPRALALVRDDAVWSQLVPAAADAPEPFFIWRFHFPAGQDNSGFVGWLATVLKRRLGTGVAVICGQNSAQGGIYDYWACPVAISEAVLTEIRALTGRDR